MGGLIWAVIWAAIWAAIWAGSRTRFGQGLGTFLVSPMLRFGGYLGSVTRSMGLADMTGSHLRGAVGKLGRKIKLGSC